MFVQGAAVTVKYNKINLNLFYFGRNRNDVF